MMMSIELGRIELTGIGGDASRTQGLVGARYLRFGLVWVPVALIAGVGAWMLPSGYASKPAESEPVLLAAAVPADSAPAVAPARAAIAYNPPTAEGEAIAPEETAPVDGLRISSQYWRRGGLGSNALVTFTLRNTNDYAVKDIAISCAFSRRDGSHLTDRSRVIHDTVNMHGRKTFARLHVGFVNVNASRAKCLPVAARHI